MLEDEVEEITQRADNKTDEKDNRGEKRINLVGSHGTNSSSRKREQRTLRAGNNQINNTRKLSALKFRGLYRVPKSIQNKE